MNYEFHYYITRIIAQRAGYSHEESHIVAYSSQHVDDNSIKFKVNTGEGGAYKNYISQTKDILKPKKKLMRIYPCFHFVPGEYDAFSARRKDGKMHILNTTPGSKKAGVLLDEACATGNLYRIGIATHSYADSWAHQNFVGYFDYFNGVGSVLEHLAPNIGHVDILLTPDIPVYRWNDERLASGNDKVSNKERYLDAAEHIFKRYKLHIRNNIPDGKIDAECAALREDLGHAIGEEVHEHDRDKKKRLSRYRELTKDFRKYHKDDWLKKAVKRKIVGLPDFLQNGILNKIKIFPDRYHQRKGFENSHWFKFQEAVKEHQKLALHLLSGLFEQIEVEEF